MVLSVVSDGLFLVVGCFGVVGMSTVTITVTISISINMSISLRAIVLADLLLQGRYDPIECLWQIGIVVGTLVVVSDIVVFLPSLILLLFAPHSIVSIVAFCLSSVRAEGR